MVGGRDIVRVLNGSAFHDTHLVCSGDLSYLGGSWSKTIGSAVSFLPSSCKTHKCCTFSVSPGIRELYNFKENVNA